MINQTAQGFIEGWIWADPEKKVNNEFMLYIKERAKAFSITTLGVWLRMLDSYPLLWLFLCGRLE